MSIDKKIDYVEQDGSLNFIKNSESVTVPKRFKARKNAPATKLAYITDAEAKMLKKAKKGTPHKGPKGIPSYDSFGSIDASGRDTGRAGSQVSAAERGDFTGFSGTGGGPELPPGVKRKPSKEAQDLRSAFIAAGGGQRVNPGFFDSRNVVSPIELARAKAFAPKAFKKARRTGGILGFLRSGGILGNLIRGLGQRFGLGKKFNEPTYDMSQFSGLGLFEPSVNPVFDDGSNDDLLSITSTPKTVAPIAVNNQITPLTIFDDQVAPMGVPVDKGIIQALASATAPEIMTDYVNQLERGEPITDDEQMFIDNEIANLRFP